MNILMLHPHDIYSSSEPWTIRVRRIACELVRRGHSVQLVYFSLDKKNAYKETTDSGIKVYSLTRRVGVLKFFRNIIRITKLSRGCDIIHFQKCHYTASLPALIAGFLHRKPVHYDWDDWETEIFYYSNPHQKIVGGFINLYEKLIPSIVDTISVSSSHIKNLSIQRGADIDDIFSAPVGAELKKEKKGRHYKSVMIKRHNFSGPLILYVGQLHGGQYAEIFIKAAHIVTESGFDAAFMIVGDGYQLDSLKKTAKSLNVSKNCIFTGAVSHDEVSDYIFSADICVACFKDNNITRCKSPLKVAEYLACGRPIIASNVGEIRNMVGGVGMLVKPGCAKSLAHGIMDMLKDDALRKGLEGWGRERIRTKYNWEATTDNILQAYKRGIRKKIYKQGGEE